MTTKLELEIMEYLSKPHGSYSHRHNWGSGLLGPLHKHDSFEVFEDLLFEHFESKGYCETEIAMALTKLRERDSVWTFNGHYHLSNRIEVTKI